MYFALTKGTLLSLALGCSSLLMASNSSTVQTQRPAYKGSCSVMDAIFLSNRNIDAKLSELYSNCPEELKDCTVNSISSLLGGNLNKTLDEALSVLTPVHPADPQDKHVTQSLSVINGLDENVSQLLKALSVYQSKSFEKGELVFVEIASQFGQKPVKDFRDALLNLEAVRQAVGADRNEWLAPEAQPVNGTDYSFTLRRGDRLGGPTEYTQHDTEIHFKLDADQLKALAHNEGFFGVVYELRGWFDGSGRVQDVVNQLDVQKTLNWQAIDKARKQLEKLYSTADVQGLKGVAFPFSDISLDPTNNKVTVNGKEIAFKYVRSITAQDIAPDITESKYDRCVIFVTEDEYDKLSK